MSSFLIAIFLLVICYRGVSAANAEQLEIQLESRHIKLGGDQWHHLEVPSVISPFNNLGAILIHQDETPSETPVVRRVPDIDVKIALYTPTQYLKLGDTNLYRIFCPAGSHALGNLIYSDSPPERGFANISCVDDRHLELREDLFGNKETHKISGQSMFEVKPTPRWLNPFALFGSSGDIYVLKRSAKLHEFPSEPVTVKTTTTPPTNTTPTTTTTTPTTTTPTTTTPTTTTPTTTSPTTIIQTTPQSTIEYQETTELLTNATIPNAVFTTDQFLLATLVPVGGILLLALLVFIIVRRTKKVKPETENTEIEAEEMEAYELYEEKKYQEIGAKGECSPTDYYNTGFPKPPVGADKPNEEYAEVNTYLVPIDATPNLYVNNLKNVYANEDTYENY